MAYLGEEIKKLGFGLMRLPQKSEGVIDVEQTKVMVDKFMEAGFTYFDTAWAYAGSEDAIREALVERYPREKYQLATKMAAWINCKTRDEALAQFKTSLERTKAGYFDFYLLHNLGESRTQFFDKFDMWNFVKEKKEEGLIKHIGFSFHSTPEELEEILKAHPEMEFVQLQINYADWENPAIQSRACYEVARKYGKEVVIMEPVKGGMLATPPQPVVDIFKQADPNTSVASWAIKFAANLEGVITVLSGMSNVEQMEDNLSYMKDFDGLSEDEMKVIKNSILVRAAEKAGLNGLEEVFSGPTAVAFSNEDVVAPAKIIDEFAKTAEKLEIKGGIIEGKVASIEEITALAKLPNRDGLLSMLLSVLQAPVRNVAYAVKAVAEKEEEVA